jgi:ribonuclease-3
MTEIQSVLKYEFKDTRWLETALNHKSYVNETRQGENNEKLEFIGDAVIDLVLAEELFKSFPLDEEGDLSKKRASLVNETLLAEIAKTLNLSQYIRLGKGEMLAGGEYRPRLMASTLEALVGAVYMDAGFESVRKIILNIFESHLKDEKLSRNYELDFKSRLQEVIQKKYKEAPAYVVIDERGAPHERVFKIQVQLHGKVLAEAEGRSKKEAEQKAAQLALELQDGD